MVPDEDNRLHDVKRRASVRRPYIKAARRRLGLPVDEPPAPPREAVGYMPIPIGHPGLGRGFSFSVPRYSHRFTRETDERRRADEALLLAAALQAENVHIGSAPL